MISINEVYTAVQSVLNKDQRGMLKPEDFNNHANTSLFNILEEIKEDLHSDTSSVIKGKTNKHSLTHGRDALNDFFKSDTISISGNRYPKPADFDFIDGLYTNNIEITEVTLKESKLLQVISYMNPSDDTPVYVDYEDGYEVISETITGDLTIYYYRKPLTPRWTYSVILGDIVYDGANSEQQDIELPQFYFNQIVKDILFFAGMNIRDMEALKALLSKDSTDDLTDYREKTLTR